MHADGKRPVPILMYDSIGTSIAGTGLVCCRHTRSEFIHFHLEVRRDAGSTSMTAASFASRVAEGLLLPARTVVLAFDDAFNDSVVEANRVTGGCSRVMCRGLERPATTIQMAM